MTIDGLLGDEPTARLLLKVLTYTVFYAGVVYVPLRLLVDLMGRVQQQALDRRAHQARPVLMASNDRTSCVIR